MTLQFMKKGFHLIRCLCFPVGVGWAASLFFVAIASAQTPPLILEQPQSQTAIVGSNVTLSVTAADGAAPPLLPSVTSGTLQLWLKADAGVVTNSSGQVSQWQDQSVNANHAAQANTNNQPLLVYPPGIGGRAAVRFNGVEDNVLGDYLHGTKLVAVPNALTSFALYNAFATSNAAEEIWLSGVPGTYGASRGFSVDAGQLDFTTWAYDFTAPWAVPTNTYRICTDRVDTNLSTVEIFDQSANSSTNFSAAMPNALTPAAGYYVGGLDTSLQYIQRDDLPGDIAEVILYSGYLSEADRLAVLAYLQQKYYLVGVTNGLSFQWQFDGTNITGATNATLTLTDAQTAESGSYSVIVTNLEGSATSSNAVLTVNPPPPCALAPAGLIGWWPAEGNANDIAGGNNGSPSHGASFGPGEVGQAFALNGIDEYVAMPDSPSLRPASLTVEGWLNFQGFPGYLQLFVAKPYGPGTLDSWAIGYNNDTHQFFGTIVSVGGVQQPVLNYTWTPATGTWHHVAYTFDANASYQTMYVDGVEVASGASSGPIAYDSHPMQFGADIENGAPAYFFDGSIDEVSLYSRALSGTEIAAIYNAGGTGKCGLPPTILAQPQSQSVAVGGTAKFSVTTSGTAPLAYQWSLNGTNIAGATNASLALTNVDFSSAGSYAVALTNAFGSTASSNAVLTAGNSPSITVQPQSQEVTQGTAVTLSASVTGTAPLSFQWFLNGVALAQATNSALSLTNVQATNAGSYAVTVSSPFGSVVSSNAVLTVDLLPVIAVQPQSQTVIVGTNVTFSVALGGSMLPSVSSGTLQLWLKADAGVVTNSSGQVSQWQDQSGNANHAAQANINQRPSLVYPAALGARAAVRFNGIADSGDYLHGTNDVGIPNAYTSFLVYELNSYTPALQLADLVGVPITYGSCRCDYLPSGSMALSTWTYTYNTGYLVPTNTYRIWNDRVNTNLATVQMYDVSDGGSTNFTENLSGTSAPGAGYYVGGLNINEPPYIINGFNFGGDIAELIYFSGYLSETDRLAVLGYLEQKYYQVGVTNGFTFQWQFDGTNIAGATNATLTLSNLQTTAAGSYSVIVTDLAGSAASSNAVLTLLSPPLITSSPASQAVVAGTSVSFSAAAAGTAPITYQWQFDGANITGATSASLTVSNALLANAGSYWMVATNPYGSATSSVATLSVAESTVQVVSTAAAGGGTVVVSIDLNALGTESGVGFTLDFDPSVLTFSGVVSGSGGAGGALLVNSNQAASGFLGLGVVLFSGTFSAGTLDLLDVTFQIAPVTNATATTLTFGNQLTEELISDSMAQPLPAAYLPGNVAVSPAPLEGDVAPRPNGNEVLNISDWIQEGRFVAGLDTVSNGSEFQRADCAPRATLGDGQITVADWEQVGRYVVGLDPLTVAGGPASPVMHLAARYQPVKNDLPSRVALVPSSQGAATESVAVQLTARGTEGALSFSVTFDPSLIQFVNASLGSGAPGAALIQNTNLAATGNLGFVVGLLPPGTFAAGTLPLVQLNFASVSYSNNTVLLFGDTPVVRQLVDSNAAVLPANYQNATLDVGGSVWPTLSISQAGSSVVLSWPASAAAFNLATAPALTANWSNVTGSLTTNNAIISTTLPISTNSALYRLQRQ